MSGRFLLAFGYVPFPVIALGWLGFIAVPAIAQESVQVQPDVQNSRVQFTAVVNSPDVYVRSGPGEAWYATEKLPRGTQVTVVGIKFDWLKILPPPDSYCLVSKLYVQRRGDGSVGRVTRGDINVRAGSTLTAVKTTVLSKLNEGDDVKILGEEDEYYKIAPPPDTFFYVNKQFLDPVRPLAVNAAPVDAPVAADAPIPLAGTTADDAADQSPPKADNDEIVAPATTQPADAVASATAAPQTPAPATQPAVAAAPPPPSPEEVAESSFSAVEADFTVASQKPLEDQPAADLAKRYEALANNTALSDAERQTAGFRLAVLKVRVDAQARLAEVHKMETAAAGRDQMLKAEQDELQKRLDAKEVKFYAAVGTLQPSSLQFGADTLYRLADPGTGRTVIYIRGDDAAAVKLMGQFVGVRGDAVSDDRLNIRVIPFTLIEAVDPADVNGKVIAGLVPPSLAPHAEQANAGQ